MESIISKVVCCLLISVCLVSVQSALPTPVSEEYAEGDVRIVVDSNPNITDRGRVEIYHENQWGTICDHYWDVLDGTVVCRQLGYKRAQRAASFFGPGPSNMTIWLNSLNCTGTEDTLADCISSGWGNNDCTHWEDAGVMCSNYSAEEGELRLLDGKNESIGRLEIYHDNQWGTICADGWGFNEATVACDQLQFGLAMNRTRDFGTGDVPVLLSDVDCTGEELHLLECLHASPGETECPQGRVVGVECYFEQDTGAEEATMYGWLIAVIVISCIVGCVLIAGVIGLIHHSQSKQKPTTLAQTEQPPPYTANVHPASYSTEKEKY